MNRVVLDGEYLLNRSMLHETLAEALHFPEWYGKNLDALFDCLTDIREETEILLQHKEDLQEHLGNYAEVLMEVLIQAAEENEHLHLSHIE